MQISPYTPNFSAVFLTDTLKENLDSLSIEDRSKLTEQHIAHNLKQEGMPTLVGLPKELLEKVVLFVGNPALTSSICMKFHDVTIKASITFLKAFQRVQVPAIQKLFPLQPYITELTRYKDLQRVYHVFMQRLNYTIPKDKWPILSAGNSALSHIPVYPLNCIGLLEKARKESEDKHLLEFCRESRFLLNVLIGDLLELPTQEKQIIEKFTSFGFLILKLRDPKFEFQEDRFLHDMGVALLTEPAALELEDAQSRFSNLLGQAIEVFRGRRAANAAMETPEITALLTDFMENYIRRPERGDQETLGIYHMMPEMARLTVRMREIRIEQRRSVEASLVRAYLQNSPVILAQKEWDLSSLNSHMRIQKIPSEMFRFFRNIETLSINGVDIECLPEEIEELTNLKKLDISHTKIRKFPKAIRKLWKLESFAFTSYETTTFPEEILELSNLRKLTTNTVLPQRIGTLKELRSLNLSGSISMDTLPESIKELKALEELNCSAVKLKKFPHLIFDLVSLKTLILSGAKFEEEVSCLSSDIQKLQQLEDLRVIRCGISKLPPEMKRLTKLKHFHVDHFHATWMNLGTLEDDLPNLKVHIAYLP